MFKISECFYKIRQISHHKIRTENVLSICSALKAFTPFVYLHQCFVFNMEIKKGLVCKIVHNFQEKSERSIWTYRLPIDFSINLPAFYHECCDLIIELLISPPVNGELLLNNKLISHTTATLACLSHSSFFPIAGFMYDMLNSYHTAFYICGATTTLSSCLMFLIPWLMPNQQGGVFRRDSCQSRLEGLLNSQSSTPCTRKHSRSFFARRSVKSRSLDSGNSSLSSPVTGEISLCEADRAEQEYLTGFTIDNEADVAAAWSRSHWSLAKANCRKTMQRCLTRCCGGTQRQRWSHFKETVKSKALLSISAHSDGCPCFMCLDNSWRLRKGILQSKHSEEMKWRMSGSESKSSHRFVCTGCSKRHLAVNLFQLLSWSTCCALWNFWTCCARPRLVV